MLKYTREASQMCCSAALSRKKGKKYSEISIKESVAITHHRGPWLPKHSGMGFTGLRLCKMLKQWSGNAMGVKDMPARLISRHQS
jgi:hypothetical protein